MPSRRHAALCAQCWELLGSQPLLVDVQAPDSRHRSLSAQESAGSWAVGAGGGADGPGGAERCSAREQAESANASASDTAPSERRPRINEMMCSCGALGSERANETRRRASTCDLCFGVATLIRDGRLGAATSARR